MKLPRGSMKRSKARIFIMLICCLFIIYLLIFHETLIGNTYFKQRPQMVIGIFSKQENICLRNAQRTMFIAQTREYSHLDIKTVFSVGRTYPRPRRKAKVKQRYHVSKYNIPWMEPSFCMEIVHLVQDCC